MGRGQASHPHHPVALTRLPRCVPSLHWIFLRSVTGARSNPIRHSIYDDGHIGLSLAGGGPGQVGRGRSRPPHRSSRQPDGELAPGLASDSTRFGPIARPLTEHFLTLKHFYFPSTVHRI